MPLLDEAAFAATLEARPAVISFALGEPGDLVVRAHDVGARVVHQVHTVAQARQAAEQGVDALIAQGSEAGGQGLASGASTLVLVPHVVNALRDLRPLPVLAAGGIADGRGLAAALVLGAAGANVGTRFLATHEAGAAPAWKQAVLAAEPEAAVRFDVWREVMPASSARAYDAVPRVLRTPFVEAWWQRPEAAQREAPRLRDELLAALREGRVHELVPFAGQTVGLIHELRSAGDLVQAIVAEAEQALCGASALNAAAPA